MRINTIGAIFPILSKKNVVPKRCLLLDGHIINRANYSRFFIWVEANCPIASSIAQRLSSNLQGQFAYGANQDELSVPIIYPIRQIDPIGIVNRDMPNEIAGKFQSWAYMVHQHAPLSNFQKAASGGNPEPWNHRSTESTAYSSPCYGGTMSSVPAGCIQSNYFQPESIVYNWFIQYQE